MLKKLRNSIFFNIIASLIHIEIFAFLILTFIYYLNELFSNTFNNYSLLPNIFYYPVHFLIIFIVLYPIFSSLIFIASLISGILEIKRSNTQGFIINIPQKILNSKFYKFTFIISLILSILMIIIFLGLYIFTFSKIMLK